MTTAIYPGSFDPFTLGHLDIVDRASRMFKQIILGVVRNPNKNTLFSLAERVETIRECVGHLKNVEVAWFEGLTVEFARVQKADVIIRGLRAVSDFELEFQMAQMNKNLMPGIETMYLMADLDYQFLSSSVVKEVSSLGGDVSRFVPQPVLARLMAARSRQEADQ